MPLIHWHPSDDDAPAGLTGNLTVADDSDSLWAGVQQCFASVALALALTATAATTAQAQQVATQPQDELVFQQVFEDDSFQLPLTVAAVPPVYAQPWSFWQDELVFQQIFDEDFWVNPPAAAVPAVLPQPWSFIADEIVPQPTAFIDEEGIWVIPEPASISSAFLQPWSFETVEVVPKAGVTIDPSVKLGREGSITTTPTLGGGSMRSN